MMEGFNRAELRAIEKFIEQVEKRERQVAQFSGIPGSFAKAFLDMKREVRAAATRLAHKERAEAPSGESQSA